jgi:DNA-binding SARP family transcriptional activator
VQVEYRILGPLEVSADGRAVALGGRHQRALLALLLAHANEVVPVDRLIDGLWDEAPPDSAANIVQGYVSQLRKLLGRETIVTRGRGYALLTADGALDLQRFEQRAAAGTAEHAAGRAEAAASELRAALALWRGPALSDLADLPAVRPIAARLDELRLAALERRIGADLECGSAAEAAAELDPLVAEHPLRERLRALQMRALYRCGRQADALAAYRAARATLVEQLALEPSAELQELERAILRQDPSLAPTDGTPPPPAAPAVLCVALAAASPAAAADLGAPLAAERQGELVLAATVPSVDRLGPVTGELHDLGGALGRHGVVVRTAAFTSLTPGNDLARLAAEQDAALLLADAPSGLLEDARVIALLEHSPCDVAVLVGDRRPGAGPVLVPFSGAEHDWAAVELGAWLARSLERPLRLAGASTGASGRDASRLLASASLALQRALGVRAEPVIVDPSPEALVAAAGDAGVVAVGLTERWRHEGLGRARTALATHRGVPTLLVRRGLRPGGLAGRAGDTRFTWTIATAVA